MVTKLLSVSDSGGEVLAEIAPDNIFLGADGELDSAALPELAAQAVAALNGFLSPETIRRGMLAEINRFECHRPVRAGLRLGSRLIPVRAGEQVIASCRTTTEFPPWYVIEFQIRGPEGGIRAEGELKLCVPDEQ